MPPSGPAFQPGPHPLYDGRLTTGGQVPLPCALALRAESSLNFIGPGQEKLGFGIGTKGVVEKGCGFYAPEKEGLGI
jgi:hypothetical protein